MMMLTHSLTQPYIRLHGESQPKIETKQKADAVKDSLL